MPLVPLLGSVRILLVGQCTCGTVYNYTTQYADFSVYICFPFHNVHIFPQLLYNCLFQRLHWILTVLFTMYTVCAVYIYNVIFFHNYCTIHSTTILQHILNIYIQYCLQLHYPACAFYICFLFRMGYYFTIMPNSLYNNTIYNYTTQYTNCAVYIYFPFHNVNIFPQLLDNWLYNNVYSISSTYTYGIVYNYTTQYTGFAVYICFPFHNVIFFQNYCTIHSTTMFTAYPQHIHAVLFTITLPSTLALLFIYAFLFTMWYFSKITVQFTLQQCLQHILNIYMRYCLQLHYPVCWLFCLHMLSFSQCEYFSTHYCTIVYMTMFTFNLLCLHAVLFTITLDSILSVLFTYAFIFTMWYFSTITAQLTLQQCLQHIRNIYI